jgi:serine protease Do
MQQGDVIVKVNGQPVTSDQSVAYLIANTPVGTKVPIEVVRNGRHLVLPVTVTQRPSQEQLAKELGQDDQATTQDNTRAPATSQSLGLSLQPLTPQVAQSLKIAPDVRGVVITAVDPNSDAADKGLQRGDVIISVNQQPVTTPAQVAAIVQAARKAGRTNALLLVKRGTEIPAFVGVEIPKP